MKILRKAIGDCEFGKMPWALLAAAVVLVLIGALFITSAESVGYAKKQLVFGAVGIVVFFCMALLNFRHLSSVSLLLYAAGICSLALLFKFGGTETTVHRWYNLGLFSVQPSELMKYIVVIALADYFCFRRKLDTLGSLVPPLVLTLLPVPLIALQPDLGTAMLFVPLFFGVAFLAGVRMRNLAILVVAGAALLAAAWLTPGVIKEYQRDRIVSFFDPDSHEGSIAASHARQATIAVSAGGLHGQGWGKGALNLRGKVPERHTDFIFCVIAEEWGFYRTACVIAVFLLIVLVLARITRNTRDPFGKLLAGGVLIVFGVQVFLNVAISLHLAPITGLTLPLVSYGGSSLVSTFAGLGLAASVAMRKSFVFGREESGR